MKYTNPLAEFKRQCPYTWGKISEKTGISVQGLMGILIMQSEEEILHINVGTYLRLKKLIGCDLLKGVTKDYFSKH